MVIAQHMPEKFTKSFADSLNVLCQMEVLEAKDNEYCLSGIGIDSSWRVSYAFSRSGARYYVQVKQGPLVCRQRPSVEVLFDSVAKYAGKNAFGVMLTGMGNDGAKVMLHIKEAGVKTFSQSEQTCVVYGMPKEAVKEVGVDVVVDLNDIPKTLIDNLKC